MGWSYRNRSKPYGHFYPAINGAIRAFANGSSGAMTRNSKTWTLPDGAIEYYGVLANQTMGIA